LTGDTVINFLLFNNKCDHLQGPISSNFFAKQKTVFGEKSPFNFTNEIRISAKLAKLLQCLTNAICHKKCWIFESKKFGENGDEIDPWSRRQVHVLQIVLQSVWRVKSLIKSFNLTNRR
jgi:hypothetical protein